MKRSACFILIPSVICGFLYLSGYPCIAKSHFFKNTCPKGRAEKIVSLAPNITEMLYSLEVGNRIAGVTDFCNYPLEAKGKPSVGGLINPSLERILNLGADLVISTIDKKEALYSKLIDCNIPVMIVPVKSINDIFNTILEIGKVLDVQEAAERLVLQMRKDIDYVKGKLPNITQRPRVLFIVNTYPIMAVGKNTFASDLIELAGGENISGDTDLQYPIYKLEEILVKQPQVIIMSTMGNDRITRETLDWWKKWEVIPAVKTQKIFVINGDIIHRPSPRITQGLKILAKALHPEVFK